MQLVELTFGEEQMLLVRKGERVLGSYWFAYGGARSELAIADRCTTRKHALLKLRLTGLAKPSWLTPGQGSCPAMPQSPGATEDAKLAFAEAHIDECRTAPRPDVSFAEIGIDANHVWLVSKESRTEPTRACYRTQGAK